MFIPLIKLSMKTWNKRMLEYCAYHLLLYTGCKAGRCYYAIIICCSILHSDLGINVSFTRKYAVNCSNYPLKWCNSLYFVVCKEKRKRRSAVFKCKWGIFSVNGTNPNNKYVANVGDFSKLEKALFSSDWYWIYSLL